MSKYLTPAVVTRQALREIELPESGHTAIARRLHPMDMVSSGVLPQPISDAVLRLMRATDEGEATAEDMSNDEFKDIAPVVNHLVAHVVLTPPDELATGERELGDLDPHRLEPMFSAEKDVPAGRLPVTDLDWNDRMAIYNALLEVPKSADDGDGEEAAAVEDVQDGGTDESTDE